MQRAPNLQAFLDRYAEEHDISQDVVVGSDHPYDCRCGTCLAWWATVGPEEDEDGSEGWGPFTREEIEAYREGKGDA